MENLDNDDFWPVESIPDGDVLFMRAHKNFVIHGKLIPGVFRDQENGMSTDWCKYSTPEETRARSRKPEDNGVLGLSVSGVRNITDLEVIHAPYRKMKNRAHTDIVGEKTPEARLKLLRLTGQPIIPIPEQY